MKIVVSWTEHERQYTIGVIPFLKAMGIDVDDATIKQTTKKLLEQEEMQLREQSENQ
jgi:hypothetical protein